jgi:hypothetical protein
MENFNTVSISNLEPHSNKEKYVLYLVCFNTYVKQGGGTTGNANEAATYNYIQILDFNLPNTIALFIDNRKATDIKHPGKIRPWQMNAFAEDSIPGILPSRALSSSYEDRARTKKINELAQAINRLARDNIERNNLIKEYIKKAYNG